MTEIDQRIFIDAHMSSHENKEYKNYIDKIIILGRDIMERLGSNKYLFLEYEILAGISQGIYSENIYRIGLEDGQGKTEGIGTCPTKCPTKV